MSGNTACTATHCVAHLFLRLTNDEVCARRPPTRVFAVACLRARGADAATAVSRVRVRAGALSLSVPCMVPRRGAEHTTRHTHSRRPWLRCAVGAGVRCPCSGADAAWAQGVTHARTHSAVSTCMCMALRLAAGHTHADRCIVITTVCFLDRSASAQRRTSATDDAATLEVCRRCSRYVTSRDAACRWWPVCLSVCPSVRLSVSRSVCLCVTSICRNDGTPTPCLTTVQSFGRWSPRAV